MTNTLICTIVPKTFAARARHMIILHKASLKNFSDYGIDIPVKRSRAERVVVALLENPDLAAQKEHWLFQAELPEISREDLLRVHDPAYVDLLLSAHPDAAVMSAYELDNTTTPGRYDAAAARQPLKDLVNKAVATCAGTVQAAATALETGFAYFLGGGMHHAMRAQGRGFCLVNDIVIAVRKHRSDGRLQRVWIIDTDAHRGDGTAELCLEDPDALTLSIHMENGWPLDGPVLDEKGRLSRCRYPSSVDIPIREGRDAHYVPALSKGLNLLDSLSWGEMPDLAVVAAGADPYARDELASAALLNLSLEQMLERDLVVYRFLKQRGIPQAWVMAGGYGERSWEVYANFLQEVLSTGSNG